MSWEFCSRRHEEYTTRKTIAPQVEFFAQRAVPSIFATIFEVYNLAGHYRSLILFADMYILMWHESLDPGLFIVG